MHSLPEILVNSPSELQSCCDHFAGQTAFGFDTEFIGEQTYHPRLCLVQAATNERLYLIDPLHVEDLTPFWELVADDSRVAVVHAGREESRMCRHYLGRAPSNIFDLQVAAGLVGGGYPSGHGALVQQFLRIRISKGETLTDWSRRPLTKQQIRYAYDDVRFLLPLYEKIKRKLVELDRLDWAAEEFAAMQTRWLDDDPEREPWRKLRGLGNLNRSELAVVREIFAWRAERAAVVNKPARYLLRDDLIVELAKRQPTTEKDVAVVRGVTRHDVPGLLAAIAHAKSLADEHLPIAAERDNDPPQVAILNGLLQAALASFCVQERLTPALVATSTDLKTVIRSRMDQDPLPANAALSTGWRAKHVLPLVLDIIDGKRAVRVEPDFGPAPLKFES